MLPLLVCSMISPTAGSPFLRTVELRSERREVRGRWLINTVNHHPSPDSAVKYFNDHSIVGEKIEILQKMCKCGTWIDLMVGSAANVDVDFHLLLLAGGQTLV